MVAAGHVPMGTNETCTEHDCRLNFVNIIRFYEGEGKLDCFSFTNGAHFLKSRLVLASGDTNLILKYNVKQVICWKALYLRKDVVAALKIITLFEITN